MSAVQRITVRDVQRAVAKHYDISLLDLVSERQAHEIVHPRQLAMWICREVTRKSLPAIGALFDRDHTTVMHALRVVAERLRGDPELRHDCLEILATLEWVQRSKIVPFPGNPRAAARGRIEYALDVAAEAFRRDPVGTFVKLARRFGDDARPEAG